MGSLLDSTKQLFSKKPSSPEEIKDSRESRESLKQAVAQAQKDYLNAITQNKPRGYTETEFLPVKERIDKVQKWILANLRPFAQDSLDQIDLLRSDLKDLYLNIAEIHEQKKKEAPKAPVDDIPPLPEPPKAWSEKSAEDVIWDAIWEVLKWGFLVLLIGFAVRAGSIAANQSLHMPVPYRILNFIYGTILWFYTIPYYTYQWVRITLGYREPLIQESLLPIYETKAPVIDFFESTFNWFRSPALSQQLETLANQVDADRAEISPLPSVPAPAPPSAPATSPSAPAEA